MISICGCVRFMRTELPSAMRISTGGPDDFAGGDLGVSWAWIDNVTPSARKAASRTRRMFPLRKGYFLKSFFDGFLIGIGIDTPPPSAFGMIFTAYCPVEGLFHGLHSMRK